MTNATNWLCNEYVTDVASGPQSDSSASLINTADSIGLERHAARVRPGRTRREGVESYELRANVLSVLDMLEEEDCDRNTIWALAGQLLQKAGVTWADLLMSVGQRKMLAHERAKSAANAASGKISKAALLRGIEILLSTDLPDEDRAYLLAFIASLPDAEVVTPARDDRLRIAQITVAVCDAWEAAKRAARQERT